MRSERNPLATDGTTEIWIVDGEMRKAKTGEILPSNDAGGFHCERRARRIRGHERAQIVETEICDDFGEDFDA